MTYEEFKTLRAKTRREHPTIIDCSEMNLYGALAHLAPVVPAAPNATVHRCDLALEWTQLFGLPASWAPRAFVSSGVRDSLARLFGAYARLGKNAWIPADCYPVFQRLAEAHGLRFRAYPTLPRSIWPSEDADVLLVTNPLKPAGRWLTAEDVGVLMRWLTASPSRRLLVDAVYTFGTRFHETTMELVQGGQTILLHSLTKGWLRPRMFGVALVPSRDVELLAPLFRRDSPSQLNLAEAAFLMNVCRGLPEKVAEAIEVANRGLRAKIELGSSVGYFHPIVQPWTRLVADGILGIPATVFGSACREITILSSLPCA